MKIKKIVISLISFIFMFLVNFQIAYGEECTNSYTAIDSSTAGGIFGGMFIGFCRNSVEIAFSIVGVVILVLYSFVYVFCFKPILVLAESLFDPRFYEEVGRFSSNESVITGWKMMQGVANMFFIVILLIIGVGTLLRIEKYNFKKLLVRLVVIALLTNFSLLFVGIILDFFNVLMFSLFDTSTYAALFQNIASFIDNVTGYTLSGDFYAAAGAEGFLKGPIIIFAAKLSILFFLFMISAAVFAVAFFLMIRVIALWILLILSPLSYVALILPDTRLMSLKWWNLFLKYAIAGPILFFFIWFSAEIVNKMPSPDWGVTDTSKVESEATDYSYSTDTMELLKFIPTTQAASMFESQDKETITYYWLYTSFICILLLASVMIARSLGISTAKWITNTVTTVPFFKRKLTSVINWGFKETSEFKKEDLDVGLKSKLSRSLDLSQKGQGILRGYKKPFTSSKDSGVPGELTNRAFLARDNLADQLRVGLKPDQDTKTLNKSNQAFPLVMDEDRRESKGMMISQREETTGKGGQMGMGQIIRDELGLKERQLKLLRNNLGMLSHEARESKEGQNLTHQIKFLSQEIQKLKANPEIEAKAKEDQKMQIKLKPDPNKDVFKDDIALPQNWRAKVDETNRERYKNIIISGNQKGMKNISSPQKLIQQFTSASSAKDKEAFLIKIWLSEVDKELLQEERFNSNEHLKLINKYFGNKKALNLALRLSQIAADNNNLAAGNLVIKKSVNNEIELVKNDENRSKLIEEALNSLSPNQIPSSLKDGLFIVATPDNRVFVAPTAGKAFEKLLEIPEKQYSAIPRPTIDMLKNFVEQFQRNEIFQKDALSKGVTSEQIKKTGEKFGF